MRQESRDALRENDADLTGAALPAGRPTVTHWSGTARARCGVARAGTNDPAVCGSATARLGMVPSPAAFRPERRSRGPADVLSALRLSVPLPLPAHDGAGGPGTALNCATGGSADDSA